MEVSLRSIWTLLVALSYNTVSWADTQSSIYSADCKSVESVHEQLIWWNARIKRAGVKTFDSFPPVRKTAGKCEIDLNQYIPLEIATQTSPGFGPETNINCFGTTMFVAGLTKKLEGSLGMGLAVNLPSLCQKIENYNDLRAGDIGVVYSGSKRWPGDSHAFTYLAPGFILQSPGIRKGEYPRIFTEDDLNRDWFHRKNPPKKDCRRPAVSHSGCRYYTHYYRCDFSPVDCGAQTLQPTFEALIVSESVRRLNTGSQCENPPSPNWDCKVETQKILKSTEFVQNLIEKIDSMSMEELIGFLKGPPPDQIKYLLSQIRDRHEISDLNQKRALSLAMMKMDKLSRLITNLNGDPKRTEDPMSSELLKLVFASTPHLDGSPEMANAIFYCYDYWSKPSPSSSFEMGDNICKSVKPLLGPPPLTDDMIR